MQYKVKSQIKHDGDIYPVGSMIELDAAQANPLIEDGVLFSEEETKPVAVIKKSDKKDDENKGNDGDDKDIDDELEALTVPKLLKLAEAEEIELEAGLKKPEIVEAIRVARKAKAEGGNDGDDNL